MTRWMVCILFVIHVFSCKDGTEPILINHADISLRLPGYVDPDELSDDAIFEYANRYRNFYIAGLELPVNIPLDSAQYHSARRVFQSLKDYTYDHEIIDSTGTAASTVKGHFEGEPELLIYRQKIISSSKKRYLLTVWVRGEERNKKYRADIDSILTSFHFKSL